MNNAPTNLFGVPVAVGDLVAITTLNWRKSRTRLAKIEKIIKGPEITEYDHKTRQRIPTGEFEYRTTVRLYEPQYKWDKVLEKRVFTNYYSYVKRVYGINRSIPVDPSIVPTEILEALKYEGVKDV